ncbi:MAG TPA: hypothetical protein VN155_17165 [Devosia sp.]|nr:hypothetical protein [Devosia sp.]
MTTWLDLKRTEAVFGGNPVADPDPMPAVMTIAMMDFPGLLPSLDALEVEIRSYRQWQYKAGLDRMAKKSANVPDGFKEAYQPFWAQYNKVLVEMRAVAKAVS